VTEDPRLSVRADGELFFSESVAALKTSWRKELI
jgi:hypothetical protein